MTNEQNLSPLAKEMLSRADAIFDKIAQAASKAGDFAAEQLPDIAYQFIAYNRAYYSIMIILNLAIIAGLFYFAYRMHKSNKIDGSIYFIRFIFSIFPLMFGIILQIKPFLMVWFAPKIFIMTEIVHLVKGVQ